MEDFGAAAVWLAVNVFLGATAWQVSRRLHPRGPAAQVVADSIVVGWACIVGAATVLGLVGALSGGNLLAGVAGLAGLGVYGLRRGGRELPGRPTNGVEGRGGPWWGVVWSLVSAWGAIHVVAAGLLKFPSDHDSLMYHLPLIAQWLQARSLYAPSCSHWSHPGNSELVGLWLVAPFSGDFLVGLSNVPAAVLLAVSTIGLGTQLGLSRGLSYLAGLVVVSNAAVVWQLTDAENDLAVVSLFLASLHYGVRHAGQGRWGDLVLGAVSLGLLAGVKFYALGYAAVVLGTVVLLVTRLRGLRSGLRAAAVGGVGLVVWGGYWYARNTLMTGSPLYPMGMSGSGDVLSEMYDGVWRTSFLGQGQAEVFWLGLQAVWKVAGPWHAVALLGLPVSVGWLLRSARRQGSSETQQRVRRALGLALIGSGLVLLVTPFAVEDEPGSLNQLRGAYVPVRYGLCFLSLAVLSLVVVVQDVFRRLRSNGRGRTTGVGSWVSRTEVALAGLGVLQAVRSLGRGDGFGPAELVAGGLLGTGAWMIVWGGRGWRCGAWARGGSGVAWAGVLAAAFGFVAAQLSEAWHRGYAPHYDRALGTNVCTYLSRQVPGGTPICVLDYRSYPFFGSRRQFPVVQPLWVPSYPWLRTYLRDRGVRLVAARVEEHADATAWNRYRWTAQWLRKHAEAFLPVQTGLWRWVPPGERLGAAGRGEWSRGSF